MTLRVGYAFGDTINGEVPKHDTKRHAGKVMGGELMNLDELDSYFQERALRDAFSGVALITQGATQVFAGAYGYASRSWKIPNTLATRFDTASVTKLFTAVSTLQLIERGALAFDLPVTGVLGLRETGLAPTVTVYH